MIFDITILLSSHAHFFLPEIFELARAPEEASVCRVLLDQVV